MTAAEQADERGVYASAALDYWEAGWRGVLPLPAGRKKDPPVGFTGARGADVDYMQLADWAMDDRRNGGNVALRLPDTLIGVDVDCYDGKAGWASLQRMEAKWGPLPATWLSTSRRETGDLLSGIRLYRVPAGTWQGQPAPGIEIIQRGHRYMVAAPSVVEDRTYRWFNPDGTASDAPPAVDDRTIPRLPETWVEGLRQVDPVDYDPGEQTPYAELDPAQQQAADAWTAEQVAGIATQLDESAGWPEGMTRPGFRDQRRGWERLQADSAWRLAQLAKAPWNRLAQGDAAQVFTRHAPTGGKWTDLDVLDKWRSQWRRAKPAAMPEVLYPDLVVVTETALNAPPTPAEPVPGEPEPPPDALPAERVTWASVDISAFARGEYAPPEADLLARSDGVCLFYPGATHSVHGESESGKSFVAQIAAAEQMIAGHRVLYVDFESDAGSVVGRMLTLGVPPDTLIELFDYRQPERSPSAASELAAWVDMLRQTYRLAVIDGVTDALGVFGLGSGSVTKDNDAITDWMRQFPRLLAARTGAAVVMIDHVVKNGETRGRFAIGGQAKMAGLTGAAYSAKMTKTLGIGLVGEVTLWIGKDRPGGVRMHGGPLQADQTQEIARITIDSTTTTIAWQIDPQEDSNTSHLPTGVMETISKTLEDADEPIKSTDLRDLVGCKKETFLKARAELVRLGCIAIATGQRNAQLVSSVTPYREGLGPVGPVGPTRSHPVPGPTDSSWSLVPHPEGGDQLKDRPKTTSEDPSIEVVGPTEGTSSCNAAGCKRNNVPDNVIDYTGGYCLPCHRERTEP